MDDACWVRDAGANLLEFGRRIRVGRKFNRWRQEFFVCLDAVELRRLRINLLCDAGAWHSLSLCSQRDADLTNEG
jgi:hypothetical protein